jgi:hypothetical protein
MPSLKSACLTRSFRFDGESAHPFPSIWPLFR